MLSARLLPLFLMACLLGALRADARPEQGEYLITDFGAKGDNVFDNAPIINALIQKFGASGGSILIPAGEFRIGSPIIVDRSYVTIRGVNYGQRSNIDSPPIGIFGPPGGSKIVLGAGVQQGIAVYDTGAKIVGLVIQDLAFQGSDGGAYQTAIFVDRANQWTRIGSVSTINLRKGVYLKNAEQAVIEGCWLGEGESPLHLETGSDCIVADNQLGGQPGGVTADIHGHQRLLFTGNEVFADGYAGLWLTSSSGCNISHNTMYNFYTGLLQIEGDRNLVSQNNISAILTTGSGAWAADPRGRDGLYGLIRITGSDNLLCDSAIISWQPEGDCRVHIAAGDRNTIRNLWIGALGSSRKIFVNGELTTWTRITNSGWDTEIDLSDSPTARVTYDP